jgi:hypothetical protein
MRCYGRHFVLEHGEEPGQPISPTRVAVAIACADRVIVERAADAVECGRRTGHLDPDDRLAVAVELARRGNNLTTIAACGLSGAVARRVAELVATDTIPALLTLAEPTP